MDRVTIRCVRMLNEKQRDVLPVGFFTALYLLIATYFALTEQNWEFVFYVCTMLVMIAIALYVYQAVHFSRCLLWGLSAWGMMHMVGGLVSVPITWPIGNGDPVLYSVWLIPGILRYDHIVHGLGFGVCTVLFVECMMNSQRYETLTRGMLVMSILAALGLGALNEMIEFMAKQFIPDTNVGGYMNTGLDLIANTVGALSAALVLSYMHRHKSS